MMQNPLFYTGSKGNHNTTLIDVCLDYFSDKKQPVRMATVEDLPIGTKVCKIKGRCVQVSNGKQNTVFVHGSFADVLESIRLMGKRKLCHG